MSEPWVRNSYSSATFLLEILTIPGFAILDYSSTCVFLFSKIWPDNIIFVSILVFVGALVFCFAEAR